VVQTTYDIVKARGGDLKVETKEEEGSEFIKFNKYSGKRVSEESM
jgi:hypothetical protein